MLGRKYVFSFCISYGNFTQNWISVLPPTYGRKITVYILYLSICSLSLCIFHSWYQIWRSTSWKWGENGPATNQLVFTHQEQRRTGPSIRNSLGVACPACERCTRRTTQLRWVLEYNSVWSTFRCGELYCRRWLIVAYLGPVSYTGKPSGTYSGRVSSRS